ncbi:hypothetical protein DM860_000813 [Cuscuta australis]|uniref:Uncharacterized protein n=1 Tax=Cuscuta australis TaxID=267555 RepID=A0A328D190_9ASTE|nr:hypothetical protein DM860_000813 [Cuscuta australis]
MGSGKWFIPTNCLKRLKMRVAKGLRKRKRKPVGPKLDEDAAATLIQSAFRAHLARRVMRRLRRTMRFKEVLLVHGCGYNDQQVAATTLKHIHSWSRIQSEIKARRHRMVIDGRLQHKKTQNDIKLQAKLHELQVEWSSGPETMEEILQRIQQREEAAVKRERAMAYAFSHQWRANWKDQGLGKAYYDVGEESWGWSWVERWIAVRPWENCRLQPNTSPLKETATNKKKLSHVRDEVLLSSVKTSVKPRKAL